MKRRIINHIQETALLLLSATLAGVLIITNSTNVGAHLVQEASADDYVPANMNFRSDVLVSQQQLDLDTFSSPAEQPQVEARLLDATQPAPVEELTALNTHVGKEVALFWEKPEGVESVNIAKQRKKGADEWTANEWVAEQVTEETYIDTDVENNEEYRYSVLSVNAIEGEAYLAKTAPSATVIPFDDIPPRAPANISVEPETSPNGTNLVISWDLPEDDDFDSVIIYRSEQFGVRGSAIKTLDKNDAPTYIDSDARANVTYYYTVVAYDAAGNGSSVNFTLPKQGNENPFSGPSVLQTQTP